MYRNIITEEMEVKNLYSDMFQNTESASQDAKKRRITDGKKIFTT